jgi:hypothetical protein
VFANRVQAKHDAKHGPTAMPFRHGGHTLWNYDSTFACHRRETTWSIPLKQRDQMAL